MNQLPPPHERARLTDTERRARVEDARWMAETGESLDGAAERLGLLPGSLEKWLQQHGQHDIASQLRARNYHPKGAAA